MNISEKIKKSKNYAVYFGCNEFERTNHFYPKVLGSQINKTVFKFFNLSKDNILNRYSRINPNANLNYLRSYLNYETKYFKWAGCDLFKVIDKNKNNKMIVIETNSCPSGLKSIPFIDPNNYFGSYKILIDSIVEDINLKSDKNSGFICVAYDQNLMEASGYCTCLAEITKERIWLIQYGDECSNVKWENGLMFVRDEFKNWHSIRACIRFITQKPWKKLPINSKTLVLNPIITCLAGGRNKIVASYAYNLFNQEQIENSTNLEICQPFSLTNINKKDIWDIIIKNTMFNSKAVIKEPYNNCGQGVYTIINNKELQNFMNMQHEYEKFLVQTLIGDYNWKSGEHFSLGTLPDQKGDIYVYDLRMIVSSNRFGFFPLSINCRRARKPIEANLENIKSSWELLGTNLSVKLNNDNWETEQDRLLIMDDEDFCLLGLNIDDLIEAYIQTILSIIAIDKMCGMLFDNEKNLFNLELFKKINPDEKLINEIWHN